MKRVKPSPRSFAFQLGILVQALLLLTMSSLYGCADIRLRMGTETQPQNIETVLQLNQSTQSDVRQMFGAPDGIGAYVSPITGKYSTVWSYYFAEGTLKSMDDTFLFVYFDNDVYEGYLWLSNTITGKGGSGN